MIVDGEIERRAFEAEFDWVIVGSGAAGASAARVLADTGASLAIVEEGPRVETREFGDLVFPAMRKMFRDMGSTVARGRAFMPVLQGACLGGSTVLNSAIMWRLPEDVWRPWATELGLGEALPLDVLARHFDRLEDELSIALTPAEVWGGNSEAMDRAQRALSLAALPTRRASRGCRGSARCLTGCPHGAKQSMLVSFLPYAAERGATLVASAPVDAVELQGGRAVSVRGRFLEGPKRRRGAPFRLRARRGVLVAASAVQTPLLLARSGIRSPHLGRHFQAHPGCPISARFDRPVNMWRGATQGFDADHHRRSHGFKIETISLPPEVVFARLPGVGPTWLSSMAETSHLAVWGVQLRARAEGSVRQRFFGTDIAYDLTVEDMKTLRHALFVAAEMFFAAGALEVWPGVHGLPERVRSVDEARCLESGPLDPRAYSFILSHLFGTARMALEPSRGVVGPNFAVFGTENLYVVDSSTFPTNLGVNPQETIMAVAMHAAERMAGLS